jgi:hypothetical protein
VEGCVNHSTALLILRTAQANKKNVWRIASDV